MSTAYREYLKTLEKVKRELYKKIFRASLEQGLLDNLEEKPVGIIASDLKDDKFGRKMNRWLNELARVQLLSSSEPLPLSYKMSKKITMLFMAEEGKERISFDTGIYTGINDVFLDDTMSLDELLGKEKLKRKYLEANRNSTKEKQEEKKEEHEQVKYFDDFAISSESIKKIEAARAVRVNKSKLREIKELTDREIAI